MDPKRCSWTRNGQQCPEPWTVRRELFGRVRNLCRHHARATCPEHAHRILDEILLRGEQAEPGLGERVAKLAARAVKRDLTRALRAYQAGVALARQAGARDEAAHQRGLLQVWRVARGDELEAPEGRRGSG